MTGSNEPSLLQRTQLAANRQFARRQLNQRPIFIAGASHRTGSTLVQRLLNSADDVFIWGENAGASTTLLASHKALVDWGHLHGSAHSEWQRWDTNAFVANLSPQQEQTDGAFRRLFYDLYGTAPNGVPTKRWGFKEVRHRRVDIERLFRLFPQAKVVVINRDLDDVVRSLLRWEADADNHWEHQWTLDALKLWRENTLELSAFNDHRLVSVRYEDLVESSERVLTDLEHRLGLAANAIDRTTLNVRIHSDGAQGRAQRTDAATPSSRNTDIEAFLAEPETIAAQAVYRSQRRVEGSA